MLFSTKETVIKQKSDLVLKIANHYIINLAE